MTGLIIRKEWLDLILAGRKTWEIRGSATRTRGPIALIESGSGTVVGVCNLTNVVGPLSLAQLRSARRGHRAPVRRDLPYRKIYGWVLAKARRLARPIPYRHPPGAVIWVRLPASLERRMTS